MSKQCNSNLPRSIAIADYILEDEGHSIAEAAKEFRLSKTTIERDLNYLACVAFYLENHPDTPELKKKYVRVKKTLKKLAKQNNNKNISKYNAKKATSK